MYFNLVGAPTSALPHFAAVGLARILEAAGHHGTRFHWSEEAEPRLLLQLPVADSKMAEIVRDHAEQHAESGWVTERLSAGSPGNAVYSPRITAPKLGDWKAVFDERWRKLPRDGATWGNLDLELIAALGEPAWWRVPYKDSADQGASRWEMKTRNKGEEFVRDRLTKLASAVAEMSPSAILAGLQGSAPPHDPLGKELNSRTPTGLRPPGATDVALAWCGLWGLTTTCVLRQADGMSATAAVWRRNITHPVVAMLPLMTSPTSAAHWMGVLRSRQLDALLRQEQPTQTVSAEEGWLVEQGVRAVVRFPIHKGGSSNAPERYLLTGEIQSCRG